MACNTGKNFNAKTIFDIDKNISHLIDKDMSVFRSTAQAAGQSGRIPVVPATAGV